MSIVLWGRANAYNVMKVHCLLLELKLTFEHRDIGSIPGDLDTEAFRALNPAGRIPVLQIDGACLWESNSICRYLAEQQPDTAWWPRDPLARAELNAWLDWELAHWQPAFIDLFWAFYRCPVDAHNRDAITTAAEHCTKHLHTLEHTLNNSTWLCGDTITLADVCCGIGFHRYLNMGLPVDPPPAVQRWVKALSQRPAWQTTAMAPFSNLFGRMAF